MRKLFTILLILSSVVTLSQEVNYTGRYFFFYQDTSILSDIQHTDRVVAIIGNMGVNGVRIYSAITKEECVIKISEIRKESIITPVFMQIFNISEYKGMKRICKVLKIPVIDYEHNIIAIELLIEHDKDKSLDKKITLIADNTKKINGVLDFSLILEMQETHSIKISDIVAQIVTIRDKDGTINSKLYNE